MAREAVPVFGSPEQHALLLPVLFQFLALLQPGLGFGSGEGSQLTVFRRIRQQSDLGRSCGKLAASEQLRRHLKTEHPGGLGIDDP